MGVLLEIVLVLSNGVLAWVTFLVVPEEHKPHAVRHVQYHVHRLARRAVGRQPAHIGAHRKVRV